MAVSPHLMTHSESLVGMTERSREIFRLIVEAFVETGEPIGSRSLSRRLGMELSPATIRNVMADLEEMGLLRAPHTSAGRLPTEQGLRLFVHGLLQVGDLTDDERESINAQCAAAGRALPEVLEDATSTLAGLSECAGLVVAPNAERPLRHIEFVSLGPGRALVIMVNDDGVVENRVLDLPIGAVQSSLVEASNFLNARVAGKTLGDLRGDILGEIETHKGELDALTARVVEAGLAVPSADGQGRPGGTLIVRGQAKLLNNITALEDLERIRTLFDALETKEALIRMLDATSGAEGVQIFIGAENDMFDHAGCSLVIAPYKDRQDQILGAIGVIGPTRLNYARIIPMVDYTARLVGRLLWNKDDDRAA
ncbi:MAG: heat-inducible transcriptional repressor HrcA [Pseudomonadota bacterium]